MDRQEDRQAEKESEARKVHGAFPQFFFENSENFTTDFITNYIFTMET
jgi:hypothetical protein